MKFVMVISCLILIFSTVTQITQEMGMHTFDSIRSTHGLLIFSITSFSRNHLNSASSHGRLVTANDQVAIQDKAITRWPGVRSD